MNPVNAFRAELYGHGRTQTFFLRKQFVSKFKQWCEARGLTPALAVGELVEAELAEFERLKVQALPIGPPMTEEELQTTRERRRGRRNVIQELDGRIRQRIVVEGCSVEVVAKNLGIGASSVRRRLRAMGLPMPSRASTYLEDFGE